MFSKILLRIILNFLMIYKKIVWGLVTWNASRQLHDILLKLPVQLGGTGALNFVKQLWSRGDAYDIWYHFSRLEYSASELASIVCSSQHYSKNTISFIGPKDVFSRETSAHDVEKLLHDPQVIVYIIDSILNRGCGFHHGEYLTETFEYLINTLATTVADKRSVLSMLVDILPYRILRREIGENFHAQNVGTSINEFPLFLNMIHSFAPDLITDDFATKMLTCKPFDYHIADFFATHTNTLATKTQLEKLLYVNLNDPINYDNDYFYVWLRYVKNRKMNVRKIAYNIITNYDLSVLYQNSDGSIIDDNLVSFPTNIIIFEDTVSLSDIVFPVKFHNLDLLYLCATGFYAYSNKDPFNENRKALYTRMFPCYQDIVFAIPASITASLFDELNRLTTKTYGLSALLFFLLMYTGEKIVGFREKDSNKTIDTTILELYTELNTKISEPSIIDAQ